ncbi:MAG: hypothetical protein CYG60_03260, partial [Actinobacteria bacterium]
MQPTAPEEEQPTQPRQDQPQAEAPQTQEEPRAQQPREEPIEQQDRLPQEATQTHQEPQKGQEEQPPEEPQETPTATNRPEGPSDENQDENASSPAPDPEPTDRQEPQPEQPDRQGQARDPQGESGGGTTEPGNRATNDQEPPARNATRGGDTAPESGSQKNTITQSSGAAPSSDGARDVTGGERTVEAKPVASVTPADGAAPETDAPGVDRTLFSITNDASGYDVARLSPGREPEETDQDLPDLQAAVDTAKDRGAYGELMTPEEALAPSASSDAPAGRTVESAPVLAAEPQAPTEAAPASFDAEEAGPYASSPAEELPVSTSPEAAPVQYGGATQGTGAAAEQYADAVGPAGVDPVETWGSPETDSVASEAPAAPSAEIADAALGEAATPLMDEVGTTAGGFPSS